MSGIVTVIPVYMTRIWTLLGSQAANCRTKTFWLMSAVRPLNAFVVKGWIAFGKRMEHYLRSDLIGFRIIDVDNTSES